MSFNFVKESIVLPPIEDIESEVQDYILVRSKNKKKIINIFHERGIEYKLGQTFRVTNVSYNYVSFSVSKDIYSIIRSILHELSSDITPTPPEDSPPGDSPIFYANTPTPPEDSPPEDSPIFYANTPTPPEDSPPYIPGDSSVEYPKYEETERFVNGIKYIYNGASGLWEKAE